MKPFKFTTKKAKYGGENLYFYFDGEKYLLDTYFPDVEEHFGINPSSIDLDDFFTNELMYEIGNTLFYELDHDDYDFDFDFKNENYLAIANWALESENNSDK